MKLSGYLVKCSLVVVCVQTLWMNTALAHNSHFHGSWLGVAYQDLATGNVAGGMRALARAGFGGAGGNIPLAWSLLNHGDLPDAMMAINRANVVRNGYPVGPIVPPGAAFGYGVGNTALGYQAVPPFPLAANAFYGRPGMGVVTSGFGPGPLMY
jgi:hypothetical protein